MKDHPHWLTFFGHSFNYSYLPFGYIKNNYTFGLTKRLNYGVKREMYRRKNSKFLIDCEMLVIYSKTEGRITKQGNRYMRF